MSPEYKFRIQAKLRSSAEADKLQQLLKMISGVSDVELQPALPTSTENLGNRFDTVEVKGHLIREARVSAKLTQAEVASTAEISNGYMSTIETSSKRRLSRRTATKIVNALGLTLEEVGYT